MQLNTEKQGAARRRLPVLVELFRNVLRDASLDPCDRLLQKDLWSGKSGGVLMRVK